MIPGIISIVQIVKPLLSNSIMNVFSSLKSSAHEDIKKYKETTRDEVDENDTIPEQNANVINSFKNNEYFYKKKTMK